MSTTCAQVIARAAERSNLNDSALISETELLAYITSFERRVFLAAARENPDFFGREGNTATRTTGQTWTISTTPGNIAAVSRVEVQAITGTVPGVAVGDEVNIISVTRNPDTALAPRVYLRNRVITEYDSELSVDVNNFVTTLKLFYSYLPPARASTATALDLPDEFDQLVVLPLARLMAVRDQRPEEVQAIDQEFMVDWTTFIDQVTVFDEATVRDMSQVTASYRKKPGG